jgi:citrate synthase
MFSKPLSRFLTNPSISKAFSTNNNLKNLLATEIIPKKQAELKEIKTKYGNKELGTYTVDQTLGGMRDILAILYDGSLLDKNEGITFKGLSIPQAKEKLQKAQGGHEPLPEAMLWLLFTGEAPTDAQFKEFSEDIKSRSAVSKETETFIKSLPKNMHPMTQLSSAILHLQPESQFAKAYAGGVHKSKYWDSTYEDSINLIAKLPRLAAMIYRNVFKDGKIANADKNLDWAGNYAHMLGYEEFEVKECIRGYLSIHSDHEGGNVSAHTSHLVGSALSDAYLSYSAAVNGLAGPLHGLANQEVLKWLLDLQKELGNNPSEQAVKDFTLKTLKSGKVIPGYGHAVLRNTDPRYLHQREFAARYIKNDPLVDLCRTVYKVVPPVLESLGKVKNPWPNVDAHSGVLLYHYGLTQFEYYTVVFAVSRALGCLSNLVVSRALGLPIERPGSVTLQWIRDHFEGGKAASK